MRTSFVMRRALRARWFPLLALLAVVACGLGVHRGAVAPSQTLVPDLSEAGRGASGAFRVVFAAPRGEAPEGAELTLVFDRALRALDQAEARPPEVALTPRPPGTFRWVGARAIAFVPDAGTLPSATEFVVEVPKTLRALDGSELDTPFRFTFSTARPSLVSSAPHHESNGVLPSAEIELVFGQRVAPGAVERSGRLLARGKGQPFSVIRRRDDDPKRLVVRPRQRLPLDSEIRFELGAELVSEEGPLPSGKAQAVSFRTYGPLRVERVECNRESPTARCLPGYGVGLSFSNPLKFRDAKRALKLSADVPLRFPGYMDDDSTTTYVEVPAKLRAGQSYRVTVSAGLSDIYGQRLGRDYTTDIVMDDFFPRVGFGVTDGTLVPADRALIPAAAVNAPKASVMAASLGRDELVQLSRNADLLGELVRKNRSMKRLTFPANAPKNQLAKLSIDPDVLLGPGGFGVLGMVSEYQPDPRDGSSPERTRLAKLSDLGLTAKLSRQGSWVWLTRLSTAQPVSGAEVELVSESGGKRRYRTDAAGRVEIPARDWVPNLERDAEAPSALLFASIGNEWTYERVSDAFDPWVLPVATDFGAEPAVDGLLFSDRGVYRPGDTVRFKGIVRRESERGTAIPHDEKVSLSLRSPDDVEVRKLERVVSRWGTFSAEFKLPPAAALGSYQLRAALGKSTISQSVEVEEYRPAEFHVELSAQPSAVRGESTSVEARGEYLFGSRMPGAAVRYAFSRNPVEYSPPGAEAFVTDAGAYFADRDASAIDAGSLGGAEASLDAEGRLQVPLVLSLANQNAPERVGFDVEVTDVARQSQSAATSILVHPAEFYLGLSRPEPYFVKAPGRFEPKLLAFAIDGKKLAGIRARIELISRRWTFAREDRGGTYPEMVSKVVDRVVGGCDVVTALGAGSGCAFRLAEPGYYLAVARATDARKNPVQAAVGLYALGASESAFPSSDGVGVDLVLDKKTYKVGDTARVLVKSPFREAEALITVERRGVKQSERRVFKGSMPSFEVPITEDLRPNAFVSVLLTRPLGQHAADIPGGALRVGYAEVLVDPEARRLGVEVTPSPAELRPGDEVGVEVRVRDAGGLPASAEVALYAVDEGVLMLSDYKTPDPLPVFNRPRPLGVATLDTRSGLSRIALSELSSLLGLGKGQEAGGGGDASVRRDFRATAYFAPSLVTSADGTVKARFRLPDGLGRYRVMAVAVGQGDRFGFGSANVTASRRLMARPALPRFVRAGDQVEAGIVVSSKDFDPGEVTVSARVEGLVLEGPKQQRVRVGRNAEAEVRFALRAAKTGTARLRFDVSGNGERDAVEVTRKVQAPTVLEAAAISGSTASVSAEGLGNLRGVREDTGGLEVSVASTALVGLERAFETLLEYPYACSEQLAGRLLPLGALAAFSRDFGVATEAEAPALLEKTLRELLARQRGDGGFGVFPESDESQPWVSAYALWVLGETRARGVEAVPARAIELGRKYLRQYLAAPGDEPVRLATQTFAIDVLSALGDPDAGYATRLFESRKALPMFAKALLLHALSVGKQRSTEVDELVRELEGQVRVTAAEASIVENYGDAYAVLLDSSTRTHALVLRALLAARPGHALVAPLARGLIRARRGGSYRTTQESAFALIALDAYRRAEEQKTPSFVAHVGLGGEKLFSPSFRGRSLTAATRRIDMPGVVRNAGQPLRFEVEGSGTLFYEVRLRYARNTLPTTPLDAGFFVEKSLRALNPDELARLSGGASSGPSSKPKSSFGPGELVLAELSVVTSEPREFVVIDDPLPAGFEAINTALATTADRYRRFDAAQCDGCQRPEAGNRDGLPAPATRSELRDDRAVFFVDHMPPGIHRYRYLARATTFGRFVVPPTHVEAMYQPENFGRTAAAQVEVK